MSLAGQAAGPQAVAGAWIGLFGISVIWLSGLTEKCSEFILEIVILALALSVAGRGLLPPSPNQSSNVFHS